MFCRRYDGKPFHPHGQATAKLLSPKLPCVAYVERRMSYRIPIEADQCREDDINLVSGGARIRD